MVAANQELGTLALRPGSGGSLPDLPVGSRVRILPNHACATAAQHELYHVILAEPGGTFTEWPALRRLARKLDMIHIDEARSAALRDHAVAFDAIGAALRAAVTPEAASFPVVIGHPSDKRNRFTVKSASTSDIAGVKVGSYFMTNDAVGLPRHGSIILLFDQKVGRIGAIMESGRLNAYRTAAADAVAADLLAREDACVLAAFGTGNRAFYEVEALVRVRPIMEILVVGRDDMKVAAFIARLADAGMTALAAPAEAACARADIITCAKSAKAPLFQADWVRLGTHVASMGSDGKGKQELPPALFSRASLWCDPLEQSRDVGEFQHAGREIPIRAIGSLSAQACVGRKNRD